MLLASLSLALVAFDSGGGATHCPDVKACLTDARVDRQNSLGNCGFGLSLFGLDLSLGGPECFGTVYTYPAHEICHGHANPGTLCLYEQRLVITAEKCECSRATLLGTGIFLPECECEFAGNVGTLEDFQTANCASLGQPEPGVRPTPPAAGGAR